MAGTKRNERPLKEQNDELQHQLAHPKALESFARLRGKIANVKLPQLLINDDAELIEFARDFEILSSIIHWLRLSGRASAAREIVNALLDPEYLMWGEEPLASEIPKESLDALEESLLTA